MDNLRAHKTPAVQAVLDRSGFAYRYLPSYSPDLSPIEPGWAKVKSCLRRAAARTVEALEQALSPRCTASPLRMPQASSAIVVTCVPTTLTKSP
jgi:transposase